ncbi:MAG: hypothetical protein ICV84_21465 [Flavisolibacter sp.]|nr:hypothetical protein [Flavisolibacter sp.]
MRISPENIVGLAADELIDFVATQCYKPDNHDLLESQDFALLPDYVRHMIFILRFETEYEMEGIFTLLQNSTGQYLPQTIDSFSQTDNIEIAECLTQIMVLLTSRELSVFEMRKRQEAGNEFDVIPTGDVADDEVLTDEIARVDEQLRPLIEGKGFWQNVERKIKEKR